MMKSRDPSRPWASPKSYRSPLSYEQPVMPARVAGRFDADARASTACVEVRGSRLPARRGECKEKIRKTGTTGRGERGVGLPVAGPCRGIGSRDATARAKSATGAVIESR
jgi:hypothetical protein